MGKPAFRWGTVCSYAMRRNFPENWKAVDQGTEVGVIRYGDYLEGMKSLSRKWRQMVDLGIRF